MKLREDEILKAEAAFYGKDVNSEGPSNWLEGFRFAMDQNLWISVEDEIPKTGTYHFALFKTDKGKLIKIVAVYTEGWDLEVDSEGDEEHFNHKNDQSYMPKGWYEMCEQSGGSYDEMYFKRDVVFYLPNIQFPEYESNS